MLSAGRMVFVTVLGLLATAGAASAELKIDKVLPFTPETDAVRIVVQVTGDTGATPIRVMADITADGKDDQMTWTGELAVIPANSTGMPTIEKTLTKLPAQPWSPGSPKLYNLDVVLADGAKGILKRRYRFGFRKVQSRNGHVILNDKPIFLRGLAINPPGRGVPDSVVESRQFAYDYVKYLRQHNV